MDFQQLKQDINEIAEIASSVPEQFRDRCFDLLLTQYLKGFRAPEKPVVPTTPEGADASGGEAEVLTDGAGEDIAFSELHAKTRKFLTDNGLSVKEINELFYKDGEDILLLYEDLGTNQLSESQLRISLLQALRRAFDTGDFIFNGEDVRTEAQERKSYDMANFASNFKSHAKNYDGFEKYSKNSPTIRLSAEGKKRLAKLIKDLTE